MSYPPHSMVQAEAQKRREIPIRTRLTFLRTYLEPKASGTSPRSSNLTRLPQD